MTKPGVLITHKNFLPITDHTPPLSLGEGNTPLVYAPRLSQRTGAAIYLKLEGCNPTGSFKDRGMVVAVAKAAEEGARAVICASTGNTAAVVTISQKTLGALRGVDRPALALLVPTQKGSTLLIDVGANANCRPHHLEQFAVMGRIFMANIMGLPEPRIGLMSIGEEKGKGVSEITDAGFDKAERLLQHAGILTTGSLYDMQNAHLLHHLRNAITAKEAYQKDREYVVKDGEVIIVDEFTGRLMLGRRYEGGLHQAIEAKEHVPVQKESLTYATITIQNY